MSIDEKIIDALRFYAGREQMPKLKKYGVTMATDALKAIEAARAPVACEDEGCPHYGKAIKCERKPGGCIATVADQPINNLRSVGLTEKGECQDEAKELGGVQVPGAAPNHQPDEKPRCMINLDKTYACGFELDSEGNCPRHGKGLTKREAGTPVEDIMDELRRWENDGWVHLDDIADTLNGKPITLKNHSYWRLIETAAKDEAAHAILLYGHGSYAVCTWYPAVEKWLFCENGKTLVFFDGATHWMPLPAPPKSDSIEDGAPK